MMRILLLSAIGILLILVVVLIYASTRPDRFRIERSVLVNVPPEKIFPLIHEFKQWEAWSPWEKLDSTLQRSYSGPASGVGAVYAWQGNKHVGAGRMEIIESVPASKLVIKLDFSAPFEAHNQVEFLLAKEGEATRLTQAMYGPSPFMSKLMGLVFNMDNMVGSKYEEGLAAIKALAEK